MKKYIAVIFIAILLLGCKKAEEARRMNEQISFEKDKKECVASLTDDQIKFVWEKAETLYAENIKNEQENEIKGREKFKRENEERLKNCTDVVYRQRNSDVCKPRGGLYLGSSEPYDQPATQTEIQYKKAQFKETQFTYLAFELCEKKKP